MSAVQAFAVGRIGLALLFWAERIAVLRPSHHLSQPDILLVSLIPWVSSTALLFGFYSRASAAVTGGLVLLLHVWAGGMREWGGGGIPFDTTSTWLLGLSLLVLATTPCGRAWSVDAWRDPSTAPAPMWGRDLIRVHVSVIFAALLLAHLTPEFLSGERLYRMLTDRHTAVVGARPALMALSVLWVALEAACVAAPWVGRRWLVPVGVGFVLLQYPLLYTGTWSLLAALLLLLCVDPEGPDAPGYR